MKKITLAIAAALLSTVGMAQVKYKLSRSADNKTYVVSLVPDVTWSLPQSITTTALVTVKVPASSHFIAGRITSLVPNTTWSDNAYMEQPVGDRNFDYISFNLQTIGTKAFAIESGRELPLFSFQNIGTSCFTSVELVDNNAASTKAVIAGGFSVGQSFTTLGANGEAYTGISGNSKLDCPGVTSNQDLENAPLSIARIFPTPASSELTVEWKLDKMMSEKLNLVVTNAIGETVFTQALQPSTTLTTNKINVKSWAEGAYFLRLMSETGGSKTKSFVVVH